MMDESVRLYTTLHRFISTSFIIQFFYLIHDNAHPAHRVELFNMGALMAVILLQYENAVLIALFLNLIGFMSAVKKVTLGKSCQNKSCSIFSKIWIF